VSKVSDSLFARGPRFRSKSQGFANVTGAKSDSILALLQNTAYRALARIYNADSFARRSQKKQTLDKQKTRTLK